MISLILHTFPNIKISTECLKIRKKFQSTGNKWVHGNSKTKGKAKLSLNYYCYQRCLYSCEMLTMLDKWWLGLGLGTHIDGWGLTTSLLKSNSCFKFCLLRNFWFDHNMVNWTVGFAFLGQLTNSNSQLTFYSCINTAGGINNSVRKEGHQTASPSRALSQENTEK